MSDGIRHFFPLKNFVDFSVLSDTLSNFDFAPYTQKIYECTLMRLKTADIDQEVKERAISCMGQIICNLGDYLQVIKYSYSTGPFICFERLRFNTIYRLF